MPARRIPWSPAVVAGPALAVLFAAFAWVTTQDKAIRAGSPWQDDPYDAVVSFTEILVPGLALLIGLRMLVPWSAARDRQLVRAALVIVVMVAATAGVDWIAVATGADRPLWTGATPGLIVGLAALSVAAAAAAVPAVRAGGPPPHRRSSARTWWPRRRSSRR